MKPVLLACFLLSANFEISAADEAWIMSIPHAISAENIYKVAIREIDGEPVHPGKSYAISPGAHQISLRMMLKVEWDPVLPDAPKVTPDQVMTIEVRPGVSYQLAARFDPDAPLDSQLDGSYWKPFIYRHSNGASQAEE